MNFNEMNTAHIIDGIRNGEIDSDTFNSFEEYLECSRKYERLMKANSEFVKSNITSTEVYQENKLLREIADKIIEHKKTCLEAFCICAEYGMIDLLNTFSKKEKA